MQLLQDDIQGSTAEEKEDEELMRYKSLYLFSWILFFFNKISSFLKKMSSFFKTCQISLEKFKFSSQNLKVL